MTETSHSSSDALTMTHYVLTEVCDTAKHKHSLADAMLTRESRGKPELFFTEPPESYVQKKRMNLPQSDGDI